MILRLTLDLPEDEGYIRTTRVLSHALLEDMNVSRETINDVECILTELCSNVVRHAHSKAARFHVLLEYFQPKVVITVADWGEGFSLENIPEPGTMRPDGSGGIRLGGFGLTLLEGLSDVLDFVESDPHGTTVRVEKNLVYDTPGDARDATVRDAGAAGDAAADTG